MDSMFTVRVDLSSVLGNNSDEVYMSMVDRRKMTVVYQFKEWIRFLFSIQDCIHLVSEGALIHDLENINILALLKTVRVKQCSDNLCTAKIHQGLLTNFHNADLWTQNQANKETVKLNHGDSNNVQTNYTNNANTVVMDHKKKNSEDMVDHSGMKFEINHFTSSSSNNLNGNVQSNKIQHSCLYETQVHDPINASNSSENFMSCKKSSLNTTGSDNSISYHNKLGGQEKSQNSLDTKIFGSCGEFVKSNAAKSEAESYNSPKDVISKKHNMGKRIGPKPFTLGYILNELRNEKRDESIKTDNNISKKSESEELCFTPLNADVADFNSEGREFEDYVAKQPRKRIRKHKSKKRKGECEVVNASSNPFTPTTPDSRFSSPTSYQKAKHIRFDSEETDWTPVSDEGNVSSKFKESIDVVPNDCSASFQSPLVPSKNHLELEELKHILEQKKRILKSTAEASRLDDTVNNKNNLIENDDCHEKNEANGENAISGDQNSLQSSFQESENLNKNLATDSNSVKSKDKKLESDSYSIFELKSKMYNQPYVFNRFS